MFSLCMCFIVICTDSLLFASVDCVPLFGLFVPLLV